MLVLSTLFVTAIYAFSSGLDIPECDAKSPKYGCSTFTDGDRLQCEEEDQIMDWVLKPVASDSYRMTAGPRDAPVTSYVPGRILNINIDVVKYGELYRGLLTYAETATGERVGKWVPSQEDPAFTRASSLCANTLLHASAMLKPYQLTLQWEAPPAGTGTVTFETLIKRGDANTGEFYFPQSDLVLTEGPAPVDESKIELLYVRGSVGESCTAACAEAGRVCDQDSLGSVATPLDVSDEIAPFHSCKLPYLSQCSELGATSSTDDYCYFADSAANCAEDARAKGAVTCDAVSMDVEDGRRFCPCRLPDDGSNLVGCSGCPCKDDGTCNSLYNECKRGLNICARVDSCDGLPGCACLPDSTCLRESWICDSSANLCKEPADSGERGCPGCACESNEECSSLFAPVCFKAPLGTCIAVNCKVGDAGCPCPESGGCSLDLACYDNICARPFVLQQDSASSLRMPFVASVLAAAFAVTNSPRLAVFVALLALLSGAEAHNWMASMSRSVGASTDAPCKPPVSRFPVGQIARNQTIQMEWMTNHGSDTYIAVVRKEDEEKLRFHTSALFDEYIENAPAGSIEMGMHDTRFAKLHRKTSDSLNNRDTTNFFAARVMPGDPLYEARPETYTERIYGTNNPSEDQVFLMRYKPTETNTDARAVYTNPRMPWIVSVQRYSHEAMQGRGPDMARVAVPDGSGTGRYVAQWTWRGYYDCVDFEFIDRAEPVAEIYGTAAVEETWTRIDHSAFGTPRQVFGNCMEVVGDDISHCLEACMSQDIEDCYGVVIAPLKYPEPVARAGFSDVDVIPWGETGCTKSDFAGISDDSFVCVAVKPREATDTQGEVDSTHYVHDPVFYATSYYRTGGRIFETVATNQAEPKRDWRFQEECVTCEDVAINALEEVNVPRWEFATGRCINCEREPKTATTASIDQKAAAKYPMSSSGSGKACMAAPADGTCATQDCTKTLSPVGHNNVYTRFECAALAKADASCSSTIVFGNNQCECYLAAPTCCGSCQQMDNSNKNIWTLQ